MKFYIVDNGSKYLYRIRERLVGHEYTIDSYTPDSRLDPGDADCIILSGGMQNEVVDTHDDGYPWYHHEFDLINTTDKPILGICLGLQMVTVALGGTLRRLPSLIDENQHVYTSHKGQKILGASKLFVHEKHQWVADSITGTGLEALALSKDGVEVVYHPTRNIIATQFHPEIDTNDTSADLFWKLVHTATGASISSGVLV